MVLGKKKRLFLSTSAVVLAIVYLRSIGRKFSTDQLHSFYDDAPAAAAALY